MGSVSVGGVCGVRISFGSSRNINSSFSECRFFLLAFVSVYIVSICIYDDSMYVCSVSMYGVQYVCI